jgi:hypothetical protein
MSELPQMATLRRWRKVFVVLVIAIVVVSGGALALYARSVQNDYKQARDSANVVRDRVEGSESGASLGLSDLPEFSDELATLEADLRQLEKSVNTPVLGGIARHTPYVGARVRASEQLLTLGIELTSIAREATDIANEARVAFETNGLTAAEPPVGPTWLDVIRTHRTDIDKLELRYSQALEQRQELNVETLPDEARSMLDSVDRLLERATSVRDDYFDLFPLLDTAFGAAEDARYFILLQNGQEIRPSGGFASTYAILTISNGRLASFEIERIEDLDLAYLERRGEPLPAPGPLAEYLKVDEWMPRDSNWPADFRDAAAVFLDMYNQAGWPPIQGVAAVNESVIADVLEIIGPYEIDIDGVPQVVDATYFLELIQSYRDEARHKEVVALLGTSLIEKVSDAGFDTQKEIFNSLRDAADQREVQVFLIETRMQEEVARRDWDGALQPQPEIPTLALYVSNLTGNKASEQIFADAGLEISAPAADGWRPAALYLTFEHRGDPSLEADRLFNGYHRTWLSLYLPGGATVTNIDGSQPDPESITDDPRALGFNIGLLPGEKQELTLEFSLPPQTDALYLRRQSGFNDVEYWIDAAGAGCTIADAFTLDHDVLVDFATCDLDSIQLSRR